MGKKRGSAGAKLTEEQQAAQLLRLFNTMFEKHGVMPDTIRAQDLEFFIQMRLVDDGPPLVYPESVDFT